MQDNSYVLVSACRNEEVYIEGLIDTVATQTLHPLRWIIVDDGSTDATSSLAAARAKDLPFVQVARMPAAGPRSFASQVFAAQHGYSLLKALPFGFIGFLDADIRLKADYYQRLLACFAAEARLGLAGGAVLDQRADGLDDIRRGSEDFHVAGGVQFFRRECFEQIGGYVPIEGGGQDVIGEVMALMRGWKIRTITQLEALHLRPDGFAKTKILRRGLAWGQKFYLLGYHPLFYLGQCVRRLGHRPVLVGSLCQLLGFLVAAWQAPDRPVPPEFVRFQRQLQMQRLRRILASRIRLGN
jgi:poly-beta-1,6-N-acetyl-D-glucosamine synthase